MENWNENFEKYFASSYINYFKNKYNITLDDLKHLYFNGGQITKENRINITKLYSDTMPIENTHKTLKFQVEKSPNTPTYFYVYSYDKTLSPLKQILQINEKGK